MTARVCTFCQRELMNLCYRVDDPGEIFYYCECGSTLQLRRPPGRPRPIVNEWTKNPGHVSIIDSPLRVAHGGYHINEKKKITVEPREEEMSLI